MDKSKRSILVLADYCRADILYFFEDLAKQFNLYFLYYSYKEDVPNNIFEPYGKTLFYYQYPTAFSLLKEISPEKVLFFDLETLNQVALLCASKEMGIETFHVEHGYRNTDLIRYIFSIKTTKKNYQPKKKPALLHKIRNRLFYISTAFLSKQKSKLNYFYKEKRSRNSLQANVLLGEMKLVPDCFISFSPKIFNYHREIFQLPSSARVKYIGFLHSDRYYTEHEFDISSKKIVFIDACYHLAGYFGMTEEFVTAFYRQLNETCEANGYQLLVKKHPADLSSVIEAAGVKIIDEVDFKARMSEFSIIAGDYSTLFLILIGCPGTLGFCFNMFPDKTFDPVAFQKPYGITKEITRFEDLAQILSDENNLKNTYSSQRLAKARFVEEYLYKLDGKARKRFIDIINSPAAK